MSNFALDARLNDLVGPFYAHPLIQALDPRTQQFLHDRALRVDFAAGATLLEEGETVPALVLLLRGSAKLSFQASDGRQASAGVLRAPDAYGATEALLGRRAPASLVALERGKGVEIRGAALVEAARSSPALHAGMMDLLVRQQETAMAKLKETLFLPVGVRTARLFLEYLDVFGLPVVEGTKIRVRLNQDAVAAELGVARRSVTRALRAWQEEGLILKSGGYFIVRDRARLARFAELDPAPRLYSLAQNAST
ncbi:MAG: Crp/Fnr family transcriptional regulator [Myxococcota bacterium]